MSIIHLKYKRLKQRRRRNIILNIVCVIIAGSGLAWTANYFWRYISYEITNDAFVDQYIAPINVRVGGYIQEVRFASISLCIRATPLLCSTTANI